MNNVLTATQINDLLTSPCWEAPVYTDTTPENLVEVYPGAFLERLEGDQHFRMVFVKPPEGDKCDKCGEYGQDRRGLRMACFYDMGEFNVPFDTSLIYGSYCDKNDRPTGKDNHHRFYTLSVCKACRGDWMRAIETWFNGPVGRR